MSNQKGETILIVIVFMLIMAFLISSIGLINATQTMSNVKSTIFAKALNLAEAGIRYGTTNPIQGNSNIFTLSDPNQVIIIQAPVTGQIVSTGVVNSGTQYESRITLVRNGNNTGGMQGADQDTTGNNRNIVDLDAATFFNLNALDLSHASLRVAVTSYQSTQGSHPFWAGLSKFNLNLTSDSDNPSCNIGYLMIPIKQTYVSTIASSYSTYGNVSYEFQAKVGWYNTVNYAAQGLNFRWQQSVAFPGKYQGFGLSFMVFNSQTQCTTNPDYIPNDIKPGAGNALSGRLLLVLWEQWVDTGGTERRKWLAYAELGNPTGVWAPANGPRTTTPADRDQMVSGWQDTTDGRVTDSATIGVRIDDVIYNGVHHNDIKVFYGDASPYFDTSAQRVADAYATNVQRLKYSPQWANSSLFTTWPSHYYENLNSTDNTLTYWSYCPWWANDAYSLNNIVIPTMRKASDGLTHNYLATVAGTSGSTEPVWPVNSGATIADGTGNLVWQENGTARPSSAYDYFTVLSTNPQGPYNTVSWVLNPAATNITVKNDNATLTTYDFPLSTFPSGQIEVGLHAFYGGDNNADLAFGSVSIAILGRRE